MSDNKTINLESPSLNNPMAWAELVNEMRNRVLNTPIQETRYPIPANIYKDLVFPGEVFYSKIRPKGATISTTIPQPKPVEDEDMFDDEEAVV